MLLLTGKQTLMAQAAGRLQRGIASLTAAVTTPRAGDLQRGIASLAAVVATPRAGDQGIALKPERAASTAKKEKVLGL